LEEDCDLPQLKTSFYEGALNPFGERGNQKDTCLAKSIPLPFTPSPFPLLGKR